MMLIGSFLLAMWWLPGAQVLPQKQINDRVIGAAECSIEKTNRKGTPKHVLITEQSNRSICQLSFESIHS
jgi:hypothetical protein